MTLKAAAAAHGIVLGVGPVDTTGPVYPAGGTPPTIPSYVGWPWGPLAPGYRFARPLALNAATDPEASLIVNEFGGALDLCLWAVGNTDLSHYGQALRWSAPGVYNFTGADEAYAWAIANGMRVWISDPAYSGVPQWLHDGGYTPAQVTTHLHDWYVAAFSRYPAAYATTFLNEMCPWLVDWGEGYFEPRVRSNYSTGWYYDNSSIGAPGGKTLEEFAVTLCGWVRAANAGVRILINDGFNDGLTAEPGPGADHSAEFKAWVLALRSAGADIAGVGLQGHRAQSGATQSITGFKAAVASYASAGLEVHVTEFDVGNDSPAWAQVYYDIVKAITETPAITTLNFWSIRDPLYYRVPLGGLYTESLGWTVARGAVEDALLGVPLGTTEPPPPTTLAPVVDTIPSPTSDEPLVITGRVPSYLEGAASGTATTAGNLVIPIALAGSASGAATVSADLSAPAKLEGAATGTASASADLTTGVVLETTAEPHVNAIPSPATDEPIVITGLVPPWAVLEGGAAGVATAEGDLVQITLAGDAVADSDAAADLAASASHPLEGAAVASSAASLASGTHTAPVVDVVLSASERTVYLHHGRVDVELSSVERTVILERRAA
jgi:hypothetical protein